MKSSEIMRQVRNAIRNPFAWPGGYPVYVVLSDGLKLCQDCARKEYRLISASTRNGLRDDWSALGAEVYWEGPTDICANCDCELPSAYGDPDEEEVG